MIRRIEVKGLNNRLDGAWEFNEDLNVITGRNGSGKTTLLKLIWYLISGNIGQAISEVLFQSVSIETDSFSLSIIQTENEEVKLECKFAGEVEIWGFEIPLRRIDDEEIKEIVDEINLQITRAISSSLFFPSFRRIEGGFARGSKYTPDGGVIRQIRPESEYGESATLQGIMSEFSAEMSTSDNHRFIASISTYDIGELLREKHADVTKKTDELHANLSKEITQKISEANPLENATTVLKDIQKRIEQVTKQRESLMKPFSVLGDRIRDILHYKGIRVTDDLTLGEQDGAIESDKLSGGEKQLLSFWCYNTFSENTAIFIDEPELSLHVDWQRLLLPTLLEQETGNQFFVATHSPFIYGKYPEREILLGEDRGGD